VRRERSEATLDLQLACLDDRLDELRALSDTFVHADPVIVPKAVEATHALSPVASCVDLDRLSASARLPADVAKRSEIRALQGEVAGAKALIDSGEELQGLARLRTIRDRVDAVGYGPLLTGWTLVTARAETASDPQAALADFQRAAVLADIQRLDAERASAEIALGDLAHLAAKFEDSHRWFMLAGATLGRMGGDARLEVQRDVLEGWAYDCESRYVEAIPLFERALAQIRSVGSIDPEVVAEAHSGIADAFVAQGRFDEALEHLESSLQVATEAYGPLHPAVAEQTKNLATGQRQAGRAEQSLATASRALALLEAAVQRHDIAPTSGLLGDAAQTLGAALLRLRRPQEAIDQLTRARDLFLAAGVRGDMVALAYNDLAEARRMLGDDAGAREALAEAGAIEAANTGISLSTVAVTRIGLARLALDRGNVADALPLCAEAMDLLDRCEPDLHDLAEGRLVFARALALRGGQDAEQARSLAEMARATFERVHEEEHAAEASKLLAQLSPR
jgi:tetratricopeptide (TPR) repeat protein